MKKLIIVIAVAALALGLLSPAALAGQMLDRGVYLDQFSRTAADGTTCNISLLRVNLNDNKIEIKPVLARDQFGAVEPLSQMASRYGAIGAINGSYFNLSSESSIPTDTIVLNRQLVSLTTRRATSLIIDSNRKISFDDFLPRVTVKLPGQKIIFEVNAVNHTTGNGIVMYTPSFGSFTGTPGTANEVVISRNTAGMELITASYNGNAPIPANGYVLSFQGEAAKYFPYFSVGQAAKLNISYRDKQALEHMLAVGPMLVREGARTVPVNLEGLGSSLAARHPRSALGLTNDGRLLLVVVDGRQPGMSEGMTFDELADLMVELGAWTAMALDGGSSSELWANGKVINTPAGGGERRISNGILVISQIPVYIDGKRLYFTDVPPTIISNRLMVPLRAIFEALQAEVAWDNDTRTITATKGKDTVALTIGQNTAKVNGKTVKLDAPATIIDGRTLVPLRFSAEAFGAKVTWDAKTESAHIVTTGN